MRLWHLSSLALIAATQQAPTPTPTPAPTSASTSASTTVLPSRVVDWTSMETTPTKTGQRRLVFDAPTDTLDKLHLHITTLNPGENTGALHRHPQEEMVIIKEGTIEVNIDGRKQTVGPGSVIYFSVNENENMTNVGKTPATYHVIQWFTPRTPKQ